MESRGERRADDPTVVAQGGLPRTAVVGVLGGGQLGKMLATEAVRIAPPLPPCPRAPPDSLSPRCQTCPQRMAIVVWLKHVPGSTGAHGRGVSSARPAARLPGVVGGSSGVSQHHFPCEAGLMLPCRSRTSSYYHSMRTADRRGSRNGKGVAPSRSSGIANAPDTHQLADACALIWAGSG